MSRALALFDKDLPASALARMEAAGSSAAWLIDIAAGAIVAANARGLDVLGHAAGAVPSPLDAAMPALARLRELGAADAKTATVPLVFWSRNGAVRLLCDIAFTRESERTVAVVLARADAGASAPAPLFAGDDAAKLKEIARRIREGQSTHPARRARKRGWSNTEASDSPGARAHVDSGESPTADAAAPVWSRLRASLAHELKTPVSAIAAAAEIMKDQRFGPLGTPRYVGYATDIHGSAQHVLGVIERMLAEGADDALSSGGSLVFAEIDAGAVLEATVSQLAPLAESVGIVIAIELQPRLPHVVADATSLRQIVLNLLTNALKFTPRGGRVAAVARYNGDGRLTITISDTGTGMTRREIQQILSPAGGAGLPRRTAAGSGLGLGLPLVRTLAAANGAEFVVESVPGKGTSASIVFGKDRVIPV